ncbi:ABC transporter substrate-binding protein [Streptomyces cylindrosporus]|uniref:ABC transporter substrate-binding protein n=1 Tax=Streptomyces cylindrosporus TaxID=2927583 RepID=A0ABS9YJ58_9ACTN|nr:ABC transporter substrate-binding protein [Streptomyces cylindrosporus]MCI3277215.1 ABC transporter substrate-binding protein [Streptomyces cylindrosporus]
MSAMEFGALGPLRVMRAGSALPLGGPRQRAVLALLLIEANRVVTLDRLVDEIWGDDPPDGAVTSLQTYVFHLRRILEPDRARGAAAEVLVTQGRGYVLRTDPAATDAGRFEAAVRKGREELDAGRCAEAGRTLRGALELWRGAVLEDLGDYGFVRREAARLEDVRLSALEARIETDLASGRHAAVVGELEQLAAAHPLREQLCAQLMLALYRSGRQAEALACYRRLRDRLADELGLDPDESVQRVHQAVLTHDPTAAAPRRVSGRAPGRRRRTPSPVVSFAAVAVLCLGLISGASAPRSVPVSLEANTVGAVAGGGGPPVRVGQSPDGLAWGAGSVWAANSGDGSVSRIDPETRAVQLIPVGAGPVAVAVSGDDVWVANSGDGTVSRINASVNRVVDIVKVGNLPSAVAAGPGGVWVALSGDNAVRRIDPETGRVGPEIAVGRAPTGIGVGQGTVWVANSLDGTVTSVDAATGQAGGPVQVGTGPRSVAVTEDAVWVANGLSLTVSRIDAHTGVVTTHAVGDGPRTVVAGEDAVWVSNEYDATVVRLDPRTGLPVRTVRTGSSPRGLALAGERVWAGARAFAAPAHRGGTLNVLGLGAAFEGGIDPADVYVGEAYLALSVAYDHLVGLRQVPGGQEFNLVPDLATALPQPTDGGRTYTFTVRRGVHYSDGRTVRASDFRRGVQRALTDEAGNPLSFIRIIGGATCIDDPDRCDLSRGVVTDDVKSTVTFRLTEPDPDFLGKLTLFVVPTPAGTPAENVGSRPVPSTGPYRIGEYHKGKELVLVRNPYFRRWSQVAQPDGYPDVIRWRAVPTAEKQIAEVNAGRADLAIHLNGHPGFPDLGRLAVRYPSRLRIDPSFLMLYEVLNTRVPPFDDKRVRQALAYAVDRKKLVSLVGGAEIASMTCQSLPPSFPGYRPYCPYGRDLDRARKLIRASGTAGMRVGAWTWNAEANRRATAYFVDLLNELGYRATLHVLPDIDKYWPTVADSSTRAQVMVQAWWPDYPSSSTYFTPLLTCDGFRPASGASMNFAEYCFPAFDQLVASAQAAVSTDPGRAGRLWEEVDRKVLDEAVRIPVANVKQVSFISTRLGNYQTSPGLGPLISQMWVR